jgi:hypothetical protein
MLPFYYNKTVLDSELTHGDLVLFMRIRLFPRNLKLPSVFVTPLVVFTQFFHILNFQLYSFL